MNNHNEDYEDNGTEHISTFKGFMLGALFGAAFYLSVVFVFSF